MNVRRTLLMGAVLSALAFVSACSLGTPTMENIRDSKLLDRRIKETPRQKVIRGCQQESERFKVSCTHCHTTDKIEAINGPGNLALTEVGVKAQIMRSSPTFGLNNDCASCHQSKFRLNRHAERLFGPGGAKYSATQKELKADR